MARAAASQPSPAWVDATADLPYGGRRVRSLLPYGVPLSGLDLRIAVTFLAAVG